MKKTTAIFMLTFGSAAMLAQDLTSKKGEAMLPEAEDWGIAIDANPFLNYAGNFFGKTASNNAPSWNFFTANQTITGKYFIDAQTAFRGTLRIGFSGNTTRKVVSDIAAAAAASGTAATFPNPLPTTENTWKASGSTIGLAGGIEKRKGKTRLQGFYGGEVGLLLSSSKDKFTYGNALNVATGVNVTPADAFAGAGNTGAYPVQSATPSNGRVLERKNGTMFSIGLRGFIGAEYFILPKMSLGGEFGWGLGLTTMGASSTQWEGIGQSGAAGATATADRTTIDGSKGSGFALDTDNRNSVWGPTGSLRLALHF
jgi:hypothetical protein